MVSIPGLTKTMREGSAGTVIDTSAALDGECLNAPETWEWVLVEWDDSNSGPIWHHDHEVGKSNG